MLSECYALQIMFQSEKDVMYKVTFARPGEEFNQGYMVDVTDYYARPQVLGVAPVPVNIGRKSGGEQKRKIVDCSVSMGLYRRGKVLDGSSGGNGGVGASFGGLLPAFMDGGSTVQAGPLVRNSVTTKDEEALMRPFLVPEFVF